jgi:hypothetical protein
MEQMEYLARQVPWVHQDLPALQALWQRAELPWDQLDRFVTLRADPPVPEIKA